MTNTDQNFTMYRGDDKELSITVTDDDGNPVNLTNISQCQWVLKRNSRDTMPSILKTLSDGITIDDGPGGILLIVVDASDTSSLNLGNYYHEVRLQNEDDKIGVILTGTCTILEADPL